MKTPRMSVRIAYLLAAVGFVIAGWREHGWVIPLAGVAVAVVLVSIAEQNSRKRKARDRS